MALTLRKNSNRGFVGLDLDGQFLAAVQASGDAIGCAVSTELAPGIITDGEVTDVAALAEALKDFFKTNGLPRRVRLGVVTNLAIALGSICLFTRPLSTDWDSDEDENVAAALAEEIRLSVDFYMAQPDARWVGEVVVSGPGARRAGLVDKLAGMIDVPVSVADPLGRLQGASVPPGEDPYRHTVAAGLALGAAA